MTTMKKVLARIIALPILKIKSEHREWKILPRVLKYVNFLIKILWTLVQVIINSFPVSTLVVKIKRVMLV